MYWIFHLKKFHNHLQTVLLCQTLVRIWHIIFTDRQDLIPPQNDKLYQFQNHRVIISCLPDDIPDILRGY